MAGFFLALLPSRAPSLTLGKEISNIPAMRTKWMQSTGRSEEATYMPDMLSTLKHHWNVTNRREFFTRAGSGLAAIALAALADEDARAAAVDPLAPKPPHVAPRAKSVIWCFMEGGPSQVDLFDPKPLLDML